MGRPPRTRLTAKQLKVIEAIVQTGITRAEASRQFKIPYDTLKLWETDSLYAATLQEARDGFEEGVRARLSKAASLAADALIEVVSSTTEKGSVRVQAAQVILDRTGFKLPQSMGGTIPYSSREEMVAALRLLPEDVLAEAMKK